MPIYEYQCKSCGHELEKLQRISEDVLKNCPACEKPELKRLISATAFRLKGSGWYETDFKKDNQRNLVDSSGANSSGADSAGSKQKATDSSTEPSKTEKPKTGKSTDVKPAAMAKTESAGKSTTA
jgi:putative FmdB family regulatory protein